MSPTPRTHCDLVVRARRTISPAGESAQAVGVRAGRIIIIDDYDACMDGDLDITLSDDEVLLPGLVDTHVHINEPGRTDWEGFTTATRAAAAGGVTTFLDMPLNSIPPTCDVDALQAKQRAARDKVHVDVGFWGGAVPATSVRCAHCGKLACSVSSVSCRPQASRNSSTSTAISSPAPYTRWPPSTDW